MLSTISDCYEICFNPLNTSKTKQLYSVPRGRRFSQKKQNCDVMYNLPQIKNPRTTSLGFGTKIDFSKLGPTSPAPNTYNISSSLNQKHGYSFRLNREQVKYGQMFVENRNPSPQQYKAQSSLSKISYSMRNLTPKQEDKYTNKQSPGPGTYKDTLNLSSSGRYFYSTYRDTKEGALIFPEQRIKLPRKSIGPGQYADVDLINGQGHYANSKFGNTSRTRFSKGNRIPLQNTSYGPGPGCYRYPSDFGQYQSSKLNLTKGNSPSKLSTSFLGSDFMRRSNQKLNKLEKSINISLDQSFNSHQQKGSKSRR